MIGTKKYAAIAFAISGLFAASAARAQLIVGQDAGGTTGGEDEFAYFLDISSGFAIPTALFLPQDDGLSGGPDGMAVDDANGVIYFVEGSGTSRSALYKVEYNDYRFDFSGRLRIKKVGDVRTPSGGLQIINGLAWDSVNQRLIGSDAFNSTTGLGEEGFHIIDVNTGATTLLYEMSSTERTSYDFRGLDFNPADGLYYATDESTSGSFSGLCSIDLNSGLNTIVDVVDYATLGTSNIDGLAVGNGKAYFVSGTSGVDIAVYDIATATVDAPIPTLPWTVSQSNSSGGWGPNALVVPAGSNLGAGVTSATPSTVDVELGGVVSYTVSLANFGPSAATNVDYSITLGGTATGTISNINSSSGSAAEGPAGTISANFANFGISQLEVVTFDVTTTGVGVLDVNVSIDPGANADGYLGNNAESISHNVRVFPDIEAVFYANLASIGGSSPVPGQGFNFLELSSSSSNAFRQIARSPDGAYVVFLGHNSTGSSTDDMIMLGHNGTYEMIAQEATTLAPNGELFGSMLLNDMMTVNNDGKIAIANDTAGSTTTDETIIRYDGLGAFSLIAQEDSVVPFFTTEGYRYDSSMDSPQINSAGDVSFRLDDLLNAASTEDEAIIGSSGNSVVAREGIDIPAGQAGGGTLAWENFDADKFWTDATGANWLAQGDLTGSTDDDVLVVNGTVVLQQGQPVAGLTGTVSEPSTSAGIIFPRMFSNGDWSCRGTMSDSDQDFVVIGNGATFSIFAKLGDELETGSGETWSDADGWSRTFFAVARNNQGDTVISGRTSNVQTGLNAAAVLYRQVDGTKTVILRENDPIDLDGNGQFDDNAWLRSFVEGEAVLTDAGEFLAHVEYSDTPGPDGTGAVSGKAIVRLLVNASPQPTGADIFVTKTADTSFVDHVGGAITYTVMVCNLGPNDAMNVMMNDTLPAEVMFSSATNGATELAGVVSANIGTLAAFACESFDITVVTIAEGTPTNTASATSSTSDPDNGNNSGSADVTIENQVDVGVTKIDNGGAPVGMNYDYTVTVTNAGPADATNVVVSDNLPDDVSYVSSSLTDTNADPDIVDVTIPLIPAGDQVVYTITVTADLQALVTNNISIVSLNEVDTNAANDTFMLDTINGDVADLQITKTDSGLTVLGDDVTYTIDITNLGPGPATNVLVTETLPAGATLVSVSTAYVENIPGILEISYASIPLGGTESITVVITPLTEGAYINTATVTANEVDPDDGNNTAITSTRVGDFRDIQLIYSEISGDPTAVVPGARDLNGDLTFAEFNSVEDLEVSPDGTAWFLQASNNLGSDLSDLLMIGSGTTGDVLAQEGQPVPGGDVGEVWDFMDGNAGFNNANDLAFNGRARGGSSTLDNEKVMSRISGVVSLEFQQGDPLSGALTTGDVPALNAQIGNSIGLVHLLDDNRIGWYCTPITNVSSFYYPLLGYDLNVFLQSRANQIEGVNWDSFDSGDAFRTTPDGMHTLVFGDDEGSTTSDLVLVYDGAVVLREGNPVGSLGVLADVFATKLVANGTWFARGDDAANDDYAVRNGVIIAETGASVLGGAETWGNSIGVVNGNSAGDYIVAGNTSEPDPDFDTVLVMNGDTLVLREGDPIDLDGNGQYDDGVFINAFQPDDTFITDDRLVLSLVTLRNSEGTSIGDAFIRVDLSEAGCTTIAGDVDGDGDGDGDDVQGAVICILTNGAGGGACDCIDYDNSGSPDVGDIAAFVADLLDN